MSDRETGWTRRLAVALAGVAVAAAGLMAVGDESHAGLHYDRDAGIWIADGFDATVYADKLGRLRHIAVRDNGDLYAATDTGEPGMLAVSDTDGRADRVERFGNVSGSGIGIHDGWLYAASDTAIYRWRLASGKLLPTGKRQTIVDGLVAGNEHAAKTFAFDNSGHIYVNIGAPSNSCQKQNRHSGSPGRRPCPLLTHSGGIWRFAADRTGQTQVDGERVGTGIRNALALAFDPADGHVYFVQHGRDQLHRLWPDLYTVKDNAELPAEEFHRLITGADYGWPYTYYDQLRHQRMVAPEYGGDGKTAATAGRYQDPLLAFPGHWAPNALLFYAATQYPARYRGGAFVAFHGSWDRRPLPQEGYKVVFVPFHDGKPTGGWQDFADGFADTGSFNVTGRASYRPMGLAVGPDGSLYIAESDQGRIWRIRYTGNPRPTPSGTRRRQ